MKLPKPASLAPLEREYAAYLIKYYNFYRRQLEAGLEHLLPRLKNEAAQETPQAIAEQRMDANMDDSITMLFNTVLMKLDTAFPDTLKAKWIRAVINQGQQKSARTLSRQVKTAASRNQEPTEILGLLRPDKSLNPMFANIIEQNVGLIKTIPRENLETFRTGLVALLTQDASWKQIQALIDKKFSGAKVRAALIARDQVGKINASVDEYHQRVIGVRRYRWRTMGDGAVRSEHRKLNGTLQSWDKPPIVDRKTGRRAHPGQDYQCRCYAEPVLADVV